MTILIRNDKALADIPPAIEDAVGDYDYLPEEILLGAAQAIIDLAGYTEDPLEAIQEVIEYLEDSISAICTDADG